MNDASTLGVGLYSLVDAARLLKTPRRTLSRWVEGYVDSERTYGPLIEREDEAALSFGDLVELMYVRGFRDAGVHLGTIRQTAAKYRQEWQNPFPLATKRFVTDGRTLLLKEGEEWKQALTGQLQAFLEEMGKHLVHVGDLACEWRPLGTNRAVVVNPDRSFGKPIDDMSGAHTYVLANAFTADRDAEEVAWWYGTSVSAVRDAAEFEAGFKENAPKSKAA